MPLGPPRLTSQGVLRESPPRAPERKRKLPCAPAGRRRAPVLPSRVPQIVNGLVQTTGWPSVVACLGNWFGKGR